MIFSSLLPESVRYSLPLLSAKEGGVLAMICSARDRAYNSAAPSASGMSSILGGLSVSCELMRLRLLRYPLLSSESWLIVFCFIQLSALCFRLAPFSFSLVTLEKELVLELIAEGLRYPVTSSLNLLGEGLL